MSKPTVQEIRIRIPAEVFCTIKTSRDPEEVLQEIKDKGWCATEPLLVEDEVVLGDGVEVTDLYVWTDKETIKKADIVDIEEVDEDD